MVIQVVIKSKVSFIKKIRSLLPVSVEKLSISQFMHDGVETHLDKYLPSIQNLVLTIKLILKK